MERKRAIEVIKKNWPDSSFTLLREALKTLIPELNESEGERAWLTKYLQEEIDCLRYDIRDYKDSAKLDNLQRALAWVEKQGEHINFRNTAKVGDIITKSEEGVLVNLSQFQRVVKKDESQGEKGINGNEREIPFSEQILANSAKTCKDGQKPTDKVEPKFKIGDWILYNRNDHSREIIQVYDIRDGRYYFTDNVHFSWSVKECDEKSRLWTIQDAKDGDVLCDGQIILLFKQWEADTDCNFIIAHAGIDISGKLQITNKHWLISNESKPATKEQRDQLEKAMADAGYTFDFEKKDLKKVEQNKWRPSDEQLTALRNISATGVISYAGQGQELVNLYNDLKKLRE